MINFEYLLNTFYELPVTVQWIYLVTLLLVALIFALGIYLKSKRVVIKEVEALNVKYKSIYEPMIVEYLYSSDQDTVLSEVQKPIVKKLKRDIKIKFKRDSIVDILSNLKNDVTGEMSKSIKVLYRLLGLRHYALIRLRGKTKWHIKAKAIGELRVFEVEHLEDEIVNYINHKIQEVREEVFLYLVTVLKFEGLEFLNNLKTSLSEWDQMLLIENILKFDDQQICNLKPWLLSDNNSVVLFALKLAKIYSQFELKDIFIQLCQHEDTDIRNEAVDVLKYLYGPQVLEILKDSLDDIQGDNKERLLEQFSI